ncbi:helix-turn-helix domain-containing protein [Streptomyces sp. GbtcB6]|uniref:IclR family transcriptional regulator n=1 Tax=Streptomyces sp. GbtcB6 TaxID=2824751 RepID=UPI0027E4BD5B|nr:helix-turn-helix domain-containing protein [Streptomyces sp. GbtcB6]
MNEQRGATATRTAELPVRRTDRPYDPQAQRTAPHPPPAPHPSDGGGRSVLEGAFALLGAVERAEEAGLTRLAAECGLPKTTSYRLLEQLVELGAVERSRKGYRMGPRIFRLGQGWQPYPGLRTAARAPARRLARITGATVGLNVLREGQTLVLDWTPGETSGTLGRSLDSGVWPWFTAAGKVLVAGAYPRLPLGPLPGSWHRQAEAIRDRGVAFDREEVTAGVCCVAVPVHGPNGAPLASLSVVTDPAHSLDRLAGVVQQTGRMIGAALRGR